MEWSTKESLMQKVKQNVMTCVLQWGEEWVTKHPAGLEAFRWFMENKAKLLIEKAINVLYLFGCRLVWVIHLINSTLISPKVTTTWYRDLQKKILAARGLMSTSFINHLKNWEVGKPLTLNYSFKPWPL